MKPRSRDPHDRAVIVTLAPSELLERAREMAELHRQMADATSSAKEYAELAKRSKTLVEELQGRAAGLAHVISTGRETRMLPCSEVIDLVRGVADAYRVDTGELVGSRPLTPEEVAHERQGALFPTETGEPPRSEDEILDAIDRSTRTRRRRKADPTPDAPAAPEDLIHG